MKREKNRNAQDMMTLEGDSIPQPVRKKGRLRLKAKHHRRLLKGLAAASACAILVGGTFGINALFFNEASPNTVQEGFATVIYDLPTDGSTPDLHSALENIGYMNARFRAQTEWYSEMAGTVDTMLSQNVNTWKQFSDGILIQTDITTSSLINSAKQFCWVGDRVIWREAAGGPSTYNGVDTVWKAGEPYGNMSVEDFKATRGLPGTEFSVYVINEETLLDASAVSDNGDGTYTQTYYLNPATDKAPAYYVNQMMFTGGLTSLPVFEYITVTYTFDATWQVISSDIEEAYTATKGVNAKCTANYHTDYEYGTQRSQSSAYEDYYKDYADRPATGAPEDKELTAVDCLAEAFGPVLSGPVNFALDLTLDGTPFSGTVTVNAADTAHLDLRAQLGALALYYADDTVYLRYGDGVRVRLTVAELTQFLGASEGDGTGEIAFDTDALLSQLGGGTFTLSEDGRSAELVSVLSLFNLQIPVRFTFLISEDGAVSLGGVQADLTLGGMQIGASLAYTDTAVPALTEEEKAEYVSIVPYLSTVAQILSGDTIRLGVSYAAGDLSLDGTLDLALREEFRANGTFVLHYRSAKKQIGIAFEDGTVYLETDGIRLKADAAEGMAFLEQFLVLPELPAELPSFDLSQLLSTVLSPAFAANLAVSEQDSALQIALKGTELLKAFGVDFALGDVAIGVDGERVTASALGIRATLETGAPFTVVTDGYVDAVELAQNLLGLLTQDYLAADISYAAGDLSVAGTVQLDMTTLAAKANLTLRYKTATKTAEILYLNNAIYLNIEGIKVKADVNELVALLSSVLGMELPTASAEGDLLEQVLSLDFSKLVQLTQGASAVEVLVNGTELLKVFGMDFALGDVALTISENKLTASVLGANLAIVPGKAFSYSTNGYVDGVELAQNLLGLLTQDYLAADISYAAGDLSVAGTVQLDMTTLAAKANLTLRYKTATKAAEILYLNNAIYLNIEGIKVKADVNELVALLSSVLGMELPTASAEGDLLEQVLSLDFSRLVHLTQGASAVEVLVNGTELLKAFGMDFALGDVALTISENKLTASVLGANLAIVPGKAFSYTTNGYVDGVELAQNLLGLLTQDYLAADISYAAGDLSVAGTVQLDMKTLAAKANLTLRYKTATKTAEILYLNNAIYLNVEGIKVKADVNELVALLSSVLGMELPTASAEGDLLEQVLSLDFSKLVQLTQGANAVEVLVKGTELLKAFGMDFALGDVALTISENKLTASVLGANLAIVPGKAFSYTTSGYVDGVELAQNILGLLTQDYLAADISYAAGDLSVAGTVQLDMKTLAAKANLTLRYKTATKTAEILYLNNAIYLNVEGIKVKADINELVALLSSVLGMELPTASAEGDLLEQVLSLDFSKLVQLTQGASAVEVLINGTELLKVFGMDFALGDVALTISENKLTASVLGANLAIVPGKAFSYSTSGYVDGVELAQNLLGLLTQDYLVANISYAAGDLSVAGTVQLDMTTFAAKANLTLRYKSAAKTAEILYLNNAIYLNIEGIKVKADVNELVALLSSVLGMELPTASAEGDLLEQVLSLDFSKLVKLTQGANAVEVLVNGTELLKVFGMDFALGDVALTISENKLTASVLGADLAIVPGKAFSYTTSGYVDAVELAQNVLGLLTQDYLAAEISYAAGDLSVAGTVQLDMTTLAAKANLTLRYKTATKTAEILYLNNAIYLNIEGIKVKANVNELVALLSSVLGMELPTASAEGDLLEQVLSLDFSKLVQLTQGASAVEVLVNGTELLKAFGMDFALGDVALTISENKLTASLLGANLAIVPGKAFSYSTSGYVDGVELAQNILGLLTQDYLAAGVTYSAGDLSVAGTVQLDMTTLAAKANLTLRYKSAAKTAEILYLNNAIYLNIEGIKVKADVNELVALLSSVLGMELPTASAEGDLLEQVLSIDFSKLVQLTQGANAVEVLVNGTELLKAFGMDFALGDVALTISENKLTASVLGANLAIVPGKAFSYSTSGYVNGAPILELLGTVLAEERMALSGTINLRYRDIKLTLAVENGVLSWKNGLKLTLDLVIIANGTRQTIRVDADDARVRLLYGTVGLDLRYDELHRLSDAFADVYARIMGILAQSTNAELPDTVEQLSSQLGAGAAVTDLFASLDLSGLLGGLTFGEATAQEGSIGTVSYQSLLFELLFRNGALSLVFGETAMGDVTLSGTLAAAAATGEGEGIAEDGLLDVDDVCELLDFAGAAVATLASRDVTISFSGKTMNANGEDVFDISGQFAYHSGETAERLPVFVDTDGTRITLNPDAYVYFHLVLDDRRANGTDLYLDFWMLDAKEDGELDFFVNISKYAEGTTNAAGETIFRPLHFSVPASDILTLLASGVSLAEGQLTQFLTGLGLPAETVDAIFSTLNAFFVSEHLTDADKGQLSAVGSVLMMTLGVDRALAGALEDLNAAVGGAMEDVTAVDPGKYLSALGLTRGEDGTITFSVTLNSDLIYEGEGLAPLTIALSKTDGENGSRLTGVSLGNIWGNANTENTSVGFTFAYDALTLTEAEDKSAATLTFADGSAKTLLYSDYSAYTFAGVGELIRSVAASATHPDGEGYALNESFYVSGTASASLLGLVNVDGITMDASVKVAPTDGSIGANIKISYPGVQELNMVAINGDTDVELTIAGDLIYLKRTQYTYWKKTLFWTSEETYETPVVTYRVMRLSEFFANFVGQIGFLFNLSDDILGMIPASSAQAETEETGDYGLILENYLNAYAYQKNADGSNWTLTMNGPALTDDVLDQIVITLGSENYNGVDNILRTLGVVTSIKGIVDINASLSFRNPCNVWENGYSDITKDLTQELPGKELAAFDWDAQGAGFYLEPARTRVRYTVDGTEIGAQDVWYAGNLVLTELERPDLGAWQKEGYTLSWKDFTFTADAVCEAEYAPNLYDVILVAPYNLGGNWQERGDGTYSYETQMYYNETFTLIWGDRQQTFRVGMSGNVFDLGAAIGDDVVLWEQAETDIVTSGASIRIPLAPDSVVYTSDGVAFSLDGGSTFVSQATAEFDAQYTLVTPSAQGYTFLGWYVWEENVPVAVSSLAYQGGGAVTQVSALWISDFRANVDSQSKVRNGGSFLNSKYDHSATVSVSGGMLAGLLSNDTAGVEIQTTYLFKLAKVALFDNVERTTTVEGLRYLSSAYGKINASGRDEMTITVTIRYTYFGTDGAGNLVRTDLAAREATVTATF